MTSEDPTRDAGRWDALFQLLRTIDAEIEALYRRHGEGGIRARFALPLIRLAHDGPMTIAQLAESLGRSHSATSQTIAAMKDAALVAATPGADARTRTIALTERGRAVLPLVEAEWRATEAAVAELDDESTVPLSRVVAEVVERLAARPMSERLDAHLAALDPGDGAR